MLSKIKIFSQGRRLALNINHMSYAQKRHLLPIQNFTFTPLLVTQPVRFFSPATAYAAVTEMETNFASSTHQTYESFNSSDLTFDSVLSQILALEK